MSYLSDPADSAVTATVAKVAPAGVVPGAHFLGVSLPDWAAIASIAYVVVQTALLLYPIIKAKYFTKE